MVVSLADGSSFSIRPIRPSDKASLSWGLEHLSEQSVHRRFLTGKPGFSRAELRYLTEVDGHDHHALVATPIDHPDRVMAVGRFVRLAADAEAAEVAIVVADPLQGKGLGTGLGLALADAARERGIRRFTATILGDNLPAHRLMVKLAQRVRYGGPEQGIRTMLGELAA
jgi:acetyltransferase